MVAAMYLIHEIQLKVESGVEIRLFEGFVTYKRTKNKSNHLKDVKALLDVINKSGSDSSEIFQPQDANMKSAFLVCGIDAGVPPVIRP